MLNTEYITIISNRNKIVLSVSSIIYVVMIGKYIEIHTSDYQVYKTRMTLSEIENCLGDGFIKIHRGCLVSVKAIHTITDKINLSNGDGLEYTVRKKKSIIEQFYQKQKNYIDRIKKNNMQITDEDYKEHYRSFDYVPFAFTDIEMVFNDEQHAVDWIFRYGNQKLAELEELPLERLIGNSFGKIFSNMDSKWLRSYERATMYGEVLELMDYSPEVDKYLKVICFPTFEGHCGCILFDISNISFVQNGNDTEQVTMNKYFAEIFNTKNNNGIR